MSNYFLINKIDGTVVDLRNTYLLNSEKIAIDFNASNLWDEWLETGNDDIAFQVATLVGVDLEDLLASVGYGDITYNNVIALSPRALRDEIEMLVSGKFIEGTDVAVAESLNDDDLRLLCAHIMENDYLMDTFFSEVRDEIKKAISRKRIDNLLTEIDEGNKRIDEMVKNLDPADAHKYKDSSNRK